MNEKKNREDPTVDRNSSDHDTIGAAMRFVTSITGSDFTQKYGLQSKIDHVVYQSTKSGFKTLGVANRQFKKISGSGKPGRPAEEAQAAQEAAVEGKTEKLSDPIPTEDQQMIVGTIKESAESHLHEATCKSDHEATPPENLVSEVSELDVTMINIPEAFEGIVTGKDITTNTLVAKALSYSDMGLVLTVLAPAGVAATLTAHDSGSQQKTYLPAFAGENVPATAVVLAEPRPLFDTHKPEATARREGDSLAPSGVKSFVPNAGVAELFIIGVEPEGKPALVIVEPDTESLHAKADPSIGLRGAAMSRIILKDVKAPAENILGGVSTSAAGREETYLDILRRSRLGWAAPTVGTSQAVLDCVIPYVNGRQAFDEPISHRQVVALMITGIKIGLDGFHMITLRGAFRADQGRGFAREAALIKAFTTEKGTKIDSDGVQLLDGHGFTGEYPIERWHRNLHAIGAVEGIVVL